MKGRSEDPNRRTVRGYRSLIATALADCNADGVGKAFNNNGLKVVVRDFPVAVNHIVALILGVVIAYQFAPMSLSGLGSTLLSGASGPSMASWGLLIPFLLFLPPLIYGVWGVFTSHYNRRMLTVMPDSLQVEICTRRRILPGSGVLLLVVAFWAAVGVLAWVLNQNPKGVRPILAHPYTHYTAGALITYTLARALYRVYRTQRDRRLIRVAEAGKEVVLEVQSHYSIPLGDIIDIAWDKDAATTDDDSTMTPCKRADLPPDGVEVTHEEGQRIIRLRKPFATKLPAKIVIYTRNDLIDFVNGLSEEKVRYLHGQIICAIAGQG